MLGLSVCLFVCPPLFGLLRCSRPLQGLINFRSIKMALVNKQEFLCSVLTSDALEEAQKRLFF